jgi:transposase
MKSICSSTKQRILSLLQAKESIKNVAGRVGVSVMTVSRLKRSHLPTLSNQPAGRPRILSDATLRSINRKVLAGSCKTGKDVHKHLQQQGIRITYQATLNNLQNIGIHSRRKQRNHFSRKGISWSALNEPRHTDIGRLMIGSASSFLTRPRLTSGTLMGSNIA